MQQVAPPTTDVPPELRESTDGAVTPQDTIAVRRVFAKSWAGAVSKSLALSMVCAVFFALTSAGVLAFTLLEL